MRRLLFILTFSAITAGPVSADSWLAGTAKVKITPTQPVWMAGYAARTEPGAEKEHDLYAKALALQSPDGSRLVIVTLDLIGITRPIAADIRYRVGREFGLQRHELLFNASHTHCGPELRAERVRFWGLPEEQSEKIEAYVRDLKQRVARSVGQAIDAMEPAELSVAQASAGFAFNRRFPTESGYANRQYDDGPTDHDVPVLSVRDRQGKLKGILFGYACHNTTLGYQKWCGDYAGFAQYYIEESHPDAVAMFVMGAGGDQNPYPRRELEFCQQHGKALAESVERALDSPQTKITGQLRSAYDEAVLNFAALPTIEELKAQSNSSNKYHRNKAEYLLGELKTKGAVDLTYPCPVHVARIGDEVLLVAIGGEVVVDYARRIKREYQEQFVWFAGYSNDVFGYLPSLRVLSEGGYEGGGAMVYGPLPGPFDDSVEDRVMKTVQKLVDQVSKK